jgi:hypothetical protein
VNGYGVDWTIVACQEVLLLMDIERTTRKCLSLATMWEKFTPDHFTAGILQFQTYTQSLLGVEGAHLDYVTRGINGDPSPDHSTRPDQTVWNALLERPHYKIDSSDDWTKLKAWTLETAGWEWIRVQGRTRRLERAERALYNGSGHVSCCVECAKAKLEKLHWLNGAAFSYDK